ncbi:tRNA nucleotidyltransferase/poly(A) polymerase [Enterococcus sp. 10A9_DIV0425]|uniref:CCA-adding enzyme n=1 Tax=Candidatus Enterococcus wittei TaxID=1987383 RepID=A0A2C9XPL2_9ENTE|nr:CCA tRNA nucleotidyltransferase [Enterococcus sp. 10A9_DIV0425]OTP12145.1 tRNA nucleotidyltransferase/poly(A) polymerase [Enterococcus sp. 10A9_DIV0425]THE16121.1 CCA tRNA nucleotidyltransferase [Enterococcus hirae]
MKLTKLPIEYQEAIPVLKKLECAGFDAYFVGGSVRDTLLGQKIHDVDIATSAFPQEIKQLFPKTIDIGIEHGTVLVLHEGEQYEITTFRTESTYQDYRRPDSVSFVRTLAEDLKRRDFTINAFALKEDGEIIDLFDGLADLENRILRAVGQPYERFHEDALRMMRGIRFVSQLGFQLEAETAKAIQENHALLEKISVERMNVEFTKMLLGNYRSAGLKAFVETQCYIYCPGLREAGEALLRFSDLPAIPLSNESQAWALLINQMGLSEKDVAPFLKAWKCSNQMIKNVQKLVYGLSLRLEHPLEPLDIYYLGKEKAQDVEELIAYFHEIPQLETVEEIYESLPIKSMRELAIDGKVLLMTSGKTPGKWLSEALESAEKAVIQEKVANEREQLLAYLSTEYL